MIDDKLDKQFRDKLENYQKDFDPAYWDEMQSFMAAKQNPLQNFWLNSLGKYAWISLSVLIISVSAWILYANSGGNKMNTSSNIVKKDKLKVSSEATDNFSREGKTLTGVGDNSFSSHGDMRSSYRRQDSSPDIHSNGSDALNGRQRTETNSWSGRSDNLKNKHARDVMDIDDHKKKVANVPDKTGLFLANPGKQSVSSGGYLRDVPRFVKSGKAGTFGKLLAIKTDTGANKDALYSITVELDKTQGTNSETLPSTTPSINTITQGTSSKKSGMLSQDSANSISFLKLIDVAPSTIKMADKVIALKPFKAPRRHAHYECSANAGVDLMKPNHNFGTATGQSYDVRLTMPLKKFMWGAGIGYSAFTLKGKTQYDSVVNIFGATLHKIDSVYVSKVVVVNHRAVIQFGDKVISVSKDTTYKQTKSFAMAYKEAQHFVEVPLFIGHRFNIVRNLTGNAFVGASYLLNTSKAYMYRSVEGKYISVNPVNAYTIFGHAGVNYAITSRWGISAYARYRYAQTFTDTPFGYLNWTSMGAGIGTFYRF